MKRFSTFEAKNKLSSLIASAADGEVQVITNRGVETAVLISFSEYQRLTAEKESISSFLLNSPLRDSSVNLRRSKSIDTRDPLEFE